MKLAVLSELAEGDLAEIWLAIAQDQPINADRFIDELRQQLQKLAEQPLMGRARPELGREVRSFPHAAYVVIYRPNADGVAISRLVHGSRDLSELVVPRG